MGSAHRLLPSTSSCTGVPARAVRGLARRARAGRAATPSGRYDNVPRAVSWLVLRWPVQGLHRADLGRGYSLIEPVAAAVLRTSSPGASRPTSGRHPRPHADRRPCSSCSRLPVVLAAASIALARDRPRRRSARPTSIVLPAGPIAAVRAPRSGGGPGRASGQRSRSAPRIGLAGPLGGPYAVAHRLIRPGGDGAAATSLLKLAVVLGACLGCRPSSTARARNDRARLLRSRESSARSRSSSPGGRRGAKPAFGPLMLAGPGSASSPATRSRQTAYLVVVRNHLGHVTAEERFGGFDMGATVVGDRYRQPLPLRAVEVQEFDGAKPRHHAIARVPLAGELGAQGQRSSSSTTVCLHGAAAVLVGRRLQTRTSC